ncbi:hypothetical protein JMJ35_000025 [Cladonia borealis]|uniref:CST complex subunit Ten1 n=1 Tax=Cladonia borealis TaxID=184061 RepID=A0AA39V9Y2_9LECA|nr:hypothetical protein JMJ35_000025 [Cladonia borealis]
MSNGPLPTTITFLAHLPRHPQRTKVRFLGCVTKYDISTGVLELQHAYPSAYDMTVIAVVDLNLLLENLKREDVAVGAWVNIVGYVEEVINKREKAKDLNGNTGQGGISRVDLVKVQAIMLWSAGAIKIGEYERALTQRLDLTVVSG